MSVNAWTPSSSAPKQPDPKQLQDFIQIARDENQLNDLANHVALDCIERNSYLMKLSQNQWQDSLDNLSNDELASLLKFFTLAEMQLAGWEAGETNPVIWIVKLLRKRNAAPAKETLLWIKQNSSNRFLPNGPL